MDCKRCQDTGRVERQEYDAASGEMEFAGTDPCPECERRTATQAHVTLIARLNELAEDYEREAEVETSRHAYRVLCREFAADIRQAIAG